MGGSPSEQAVGETLEGFWVFSVSSPQVFTSLMKLECERSDIVKLSREDSCNNGWPMKLRQKIVLMLVAACFFFAGLGLIRGDFKSAALGVFVSACALLTNGLWPTKPPWRRMKG